MKRKIRGKIHLCSECPLYVMLPSPLSKNNVAYPFCIPMIKFLTSAKVKPEDCPMKGRTLSWER